MELMVLMVPQGNVPRVITMAVIVKAFVEMKLGLAIGLNVMAKKASVLPGLTMAVLVNKVFRN